MTISKKLFTVYDKMHDKIRLNQKDRQYVEYVCKETGWSFDQARKAMDAAKKDGISYRYYAKRKLYARSEKELEQATRNMQSVTKRNQEEKAYALAHVSKALGCSENKALAMIRKARKNCGCSYKDYCKFKLYEKTPQQQREYLTLAVSEQLAFTYNKDPEALKVLLYKGRFAKEYADLMHRKWFINRNLTYDQFLKKIEGVDDLICKPTSATQGRGIIKIHCGKDADKKAVYEKLLGMKKRMICEECIIQHPAIAAFNPESVNTIRVLTILKDDIVHHVYAGFRMGRGNIVDNFHAGGIIASIDVESGITCTDAVDLDGVHYPLHPLSKLPTCGFQIPNWDKVLALTKAAALRMKGAAMVGWDVAVTKDDVCLIEGNSAASYIIIQLPYVDAGIGMRKIFEPFLTDN